MSQEPSGDERNVLLGILALQFGLVDRAAFRDGLSRWFDGGRQRSLGAVLAECGYLWSDELALLESVAARHLERFAGDPQQSLKALYAIDQARWVLGQVADSNQETVPLHLSSVPSERDDAQHVAGPPEPGRAASADSRFRIVRPHARGGLGQVYVALDSELDRHVALKEIQEEHADEPGSRARFVAEAEITGKLEHPGIVPVYGMGRGPNGRPFYAMRFIHGDSLKQAIRRFHGDEVLSRDTAARTLRLRELLRRYIDVCNAVAYAHSRGVLHRDLKPGNVMLGPFGETLVVDWGLAKSMGEPLAEASSSEGVGPSEGPVRLSTVSSSRTETVAGAAMGTPAYMSPEQAEGRLDLVGPAIDVYGLGAILYSILTGRVPVKDDEAPGMLQQGQRGDVVPPRALDPSIPRALEAVCRKAMAVRPEERYATVRELAVDIERWLAGEPVSAWREPLAAQAQRWMRRHRTAATAAAAAVLVALVGLGLAYRREAAYATRVTRMYHTLDAANSRLWAANRELDARSRELERQRRRAEQREALAIAAVERFRDAVVKNSDMKGRAELAPLRLALLKEPMEFFRELRGQLRSEISTMPEAVARLAHANFLLGNTTGEVGSLPDAINSYAEAIELLRGLAREAPADAGYWVELADSLHNIGTLQSRTGRIEEALRAYDEARTIRARMAREAPADQRHRHQAALARSHHNFGVLLGGIGRGEEALRAYDEARTIRERLAREAPANATDRAALADSLGKIGQLLGETGHAEEALKTHAQAREIRAQLAREFPADASHRAALATSLNDLGLLLRDTGRVEEALSAYEEARAIRARLAREAPASTTHRVGLARSLNSLGALLGEIGRVGDALKAHGDALAILERLVWENPAVTAHQAGLAKSHDSLGMLLGRTGRAQDALRAHAAARAILERLARENPAVTAHRAGLAGSLVHIGMLLGRTGCAEDALSAYEEARAILERLARENPAYAVYRSGLGEISNGMALLEMARRAWPEARGKLLEAVAAQRTALAGTPRNPEYLRLLRGHLTDLARVEIFTGNAAAAARAAREAGDLAQTDPSAAYDTARALALCVPIARAAEREPLALEAVARLRSAVALDEKYVVCVANDPDLAALHGRSDFGSLLAETLDRVFPADPFARD